MEIERKFLVKELPSGLEVFQKREITQAYICTDPVLRLRRSGDECFFTFKGKGRMARDEFEYPITPEQFENLRKKTEGHEIIKDRFIIPIENGLVAELDIYYGRLKGLQTVEVEFDSVEAAEGFTPPVWFGEDVTMDSRFSNSRLSAVMHISHLPEQFTTKKERSYGIKIGQN